MTEYLDKQESLARLRYRRENPPEKIDNSKLLAGCYMYYYCVSCGALSDVLPETHINPPRRLCGECIRMKECGWLE